MLRKVTQASGNTVERVLSSDFLVPHRLSLKEFSTWLYTHHLPRPIPEAQLYTPGPSSSSVQRIPIDRRFISTPHSTRQSAGKVAEPPLVPRFIRRHQLQQNAARAGDGASKNLTPKRASKFRSRHYDSSNPTSKAELHLLEPHVLSNRLKGLCDAGKLDDAVYMLKNAPLDAQNTPVWNTLIWETLKAQRFQLGYQLFVDMKRRGFSPTTRTFQTFFSGLARIEHWSTHPKQLGNARSLYEAYQRHVSSRKKHDPNDPELSIDPLAGYIRVLGNAGQYQEVFDVYYSMDQDGPLSPNQFIFTALFQAIAAAKKDTTEGSVKVAADARMLWSQLIKASKKSPGFNPDSYTVVAALGALAGGNPPDHELAFRLVNQYFGLDANRTIPQPGVFPLKPESLGAIFKLCNQSENYASCTKFFQQIKRRPEDIGGVSILDRAHMEEVLRAELALGETGLGYHALETLEWMLRQEITGPNGPKIRPALSTYNLVIQACWRSGDWGCATRTFDLMTGYHSHDFMDGSVAPVPRFDKRQGRNLPANAEFMSSMIKTSVATRNRADMRQALRIVDYLGFEKILRSGGGDKMETSKLVKKKAFFGAKFASAVVETVGIVLDEHGKYVRPEEAKKWGALVKQAKSQLRDHIATSAPQPS